MKDAEKRMGDISGDPIMEYRRKAAEEARQAAENAMKEDPNRPPQMRGRGGQGAQSGPGAQAAPGPVPGDIPQRPGKPEPPSPKEPPSDSLVPPRDSLDTRSKPGMTEGEEPEMTEEGEDEPGMTEGADSLGLTPALDTIPPKDTTKVAYVWGNKQVRMFRRNMQMYGDSLAYSDIDSLARLYKDPIVFSDGNRQYAADSIYTAGRRA